MVHAFFLVPKRKFAALRDRDVAQPGSALRSGRRGRWFESSHPDWPAIAPATAGFLISDS